MCKKIKKIEETLDILATQKIVENKRNFILFTIDNNLINQPNTNFIILLVKKKNEAYLHECTWVLHVLVSVESPLYNGYIETCRPGRVRGHYE